MRYILLVGFLLLHALLYAGVEDSLLNNLKISANDTARINAMIDLSEYYSTSDPEKAGKYANESLKLSFRLGEQYSGFKHRATAMSKAMMGRVEYYQGNIYRSIDWTEQAIESAKLSGNARLQANITDNSGILYNEKGDYVTAIDRHLEALKLFETLKDTSRLISSYINIGRVFQSKGDEVKAKDYYERALSMARSSRNELYEAYTLNNLGTLYNRPNGDYKKSLEYFLPAYEIKVRLRDSMSLGNVVANIAISYDGLGNRIESEKWHKLGLEIRKATGDVQGEISSLNNYAGFFREGGELKKALTMAEKAMQMAKEAAIPEYEMNIAITLSRIHYDMGNYKEALRYYEISEDLEDSLESNDVTRALTEKEMEFEFNKEKLADSLQRAEQDRLKEIRHEEEVSRQRFYLSAGAVVLVLILVLVVILYRSYRLKQRNNELLEKKNAIILSQKSEVEHQKMLVEEKNKEVLDSINYAKRLQKAILPSLPSIQQRFPESYLIYEPKDIVAGDFYFMEQIKGATMVAVADCTGHGVPGALVSVVCSNALSRAVKEFGLTDPGMILDKVVDLVEETFAKSTDQVNDGMDISFCVFNEQTNKVSWSGANNPLWIIRSAGELLQINPDKQPVGKFHARKPFTTHQIDISSGDTLVLFTDGFADQFGGPSGKKYKYSQFKEQLLLIRNLNIRDQERSLRQSFTNWKGELEQVDDVCILAIKI